MMNRFYNMLWVVDLFDLDYASDHDKDGLGKAKVAWFGSVVRHPIHWSSGKINTP
jgi:hypothetical protein